MANNATQIYVAQQITRASPAQLVHMLYDRAINCLKASQRAIEAKDIQARCNANVRAMEIIQHLGDTLDLELGGEIARNLQEIYMFSLRHLMDVDRNNDPKPAQDVIDLLTPLRDSWKELADHSTMELNRMAEQARNDQLAKQAADAPAAPARPTPARSASAYPPARSAGGISIST